MSSERNLRGDRVLITGGAGMIGAHIADLVVEQEAREVVVLDDFVRGRRENLAWATANGNVEIVEGDIRDAALVRELTRGIDVVFDGTYNVVEAAAQEGVRKLVAASSASIYALAEEFPTKENHHPYANDTLYGAAKVFNEGLLRSFKAMSDLDY